MKCLQFRRLFSALLLICISTFAFAATGGPDAFGYTYKASTDPNGPVYNWIELSPAAGGTGTSTKYKFDNLDDGHYYGVPVGFSFPYYGNTYDTLSLGSNGTVYFEDNYLGLSTVCPIPGTSSYTAQRFIAHFWDDLKVDTAAFPNADILYKNFGSYIVIEYYQVIPYGGSSSSTWEVILYNNGSILLQYADPASIDAVANYSIGIQESPTLGLQYSSCQTSGVVSANLAILYSAPCGLTVNLGNDTTVCNSTLLNAGAAATTYLWSTGATTQTITASTTGTYTVTASTANCTTTDAIVVTVTSPVTTNYSVCPGGTVAANGGLTAAVNCHSSTVVTSFSGSIDLTDPTYNRSSSSSTYSASTVGTAVHYDTYTFQVTVTGSYTFSDCGTNNWDTHDAVYQTSFNPASPATNFLVSGDDGGANCSVGTNTTVTLTAGTTYVYVAEAYNNSGTGTYSVSFSGPGSIVTGGGTGSVDWYTLASGGSLIFSGDTLNPVGLQGSGLVNTNTPGTYTYYVECSSNPGCRSAATFTVNSNPVVNLGADTTVCTGSLTLNAGNNGSTYAWSNNATTQTINVATAGSFSVVVTDANSCTATDAITITLGTTPVVTLGNDVTQCGGTVLLDAGNPGAAFAWSNGATTQTVTVTQSGTYAVTVTSGNICAASDTAVVSINTAPVVNLGNDVSQCGGTVTIDAGNAGSAYLWSNGATTQTITAAQSGSYIVTVTAAGPCTATDTLLVSITPTPVINLGNNVSQCGGTVSLDAGNAGSTFVWSNGATTQTIAASQTGNYAVTVTAAGQCTATNNVSVTINALPVVTLGNDVSDCGANIVLDAGNAGSTFAWSNGATSQAVTFTQSGNYSVTVSDANQCTAADTALVTINALPVVALGNDITQCGGAVSLDAGNAGASFAWSNGGTTQVITVTQSGTYIVTVTNTGQCQATDTVAVTINAIPTAALVLGTDTACLNGSAVVLSGGTPAGGSYYGTNVSGGNFSPVTEGTNTVYYVYSSNGCADTASATIKVDVCEGINELANGSLQLYPNPNAGRFNLTVEGTTANNFNIDVVNVSGQKIYSVNTENTGNNYSRQFDLSFLSGGVYFVKLTSGNQTLVQKMIIQ